MELGVDRIYKQRPAVLQIRDHGHADDADHQLHPPVCRRLRAQPFLDDRTHMLPLPPDHLGYEPQMQRQCELSRHCKPRNLDLNQDRRVRTVSGTLVSRGAVYFPIAPNTFLSIAEAAPAGSRRIFFSSSAMVKNKPSSA